MDRQDYDIPDQTPSPDAGLTLLRPPWADPGYNNVTSFYRTSIVSIAAGQSTKVAFANPRRWAVGFGINAVGGQVNYVKLDNTTAAPGSFVLSGPGTIWLYLFQHGPLVCTDLYVLSGGITTVCLTEILIQ